MQRNSQLKILTEKIMVEPHRATSQNRTTELKGGGRLEKVVAHDIFLKKILI